MSHRQDGIVLGGWGVHVKCKDAKFERNMGFYCVIITVQ